MQRPGTISLSSNRPLSAFPDGTRSLKVKKKQVFKECFCTVMKMFNKPLRDITKNS